MADILCRDCRVKVEDVQAKGLGNDNSSCLISVGRVNDHERIDEANLCLTVSQAGENSQSNVPII